MRPIGIDLFAGAGGFSLGFEQAGFDVVAAVEVDPIHCAVHKFNFPHAAIIPYSVEGVTGDDIRMAAGIEGRQVDCVFGGAPCQGFSLIGHRVLDDHRNKLVRDFVRIVAELDARTFVFENVKGITLGQHRTILEELVVEFSHVGYDVRVPWRVLNAANYCTPQHRERLILIGARKGEVLPDYPVSLTNIAGRRERIDFLPDSPNCSDALGDLPDADRFQKLLDSDTVETNAFGKPSAYAAMLRCITKNAWHYGYVRNWNPVLLTSSARTEHTSISRQRFAATKPGTSEPISRFFRLPKEGVSNTLRAGTDGARGSFTSPRPIHYRHDRCVTVREMARLHGFPDWFRFNVTKWHGARQIGNAVPPPLALAIATEVMKAFGAAPTRPVGLLALGNAELLSLDLSSAAKRFGVEAPLNRRNKKSDAIKRKQIDIERERLSRLAAYG